MVYRRVPQGQIHAAKSLGLTTVQCYVHVILPQALAAIIPAFVNSLISCFLDTSLVTIVSMYDLTGSLRLALGDAQWRAFFIEAIYSLPLSTLCLALRFPATVSGLRDAF